MTNELAIEYARGVQNYFGVLAIYDKKGTVEQQPAKKLVTDFVDLSYRYVCSNGKPEIKAQVMGECRKDLNPDAENPWIENQKACGRIARLMQGEVAKHAQMTGIWEIATRVLTILTYDNRRRGWEQNDSKKPFPTRQDVLIVCRGYRQESSGRLYAEMIRTAESPLKRRHYYIELGTIFEGQIIKFLTAQKQT